METARSRIAGGALLFGISGVAIAQRVGGISAEALGHFFPWRCPLAAVGLACPTCGLGRGLMAVARGSWQAGWNLHPLAPPAFAALCLVGVALCFWPGRVERFATTLRRKWNAKATWLILLGYLLLNLLRGFKFLNAGQF